MDIIDSLNLHQEIRFETRKEKAKIQVTSKGLVKGLNGLLTAYIGSYLE